MEGEDLRQTLVTIGISVVMADIMLWIWGSQSYQILTPDLLIGPVTLPFISSGGSALVTTLLAMGLVLSIARRNAAEQHARGIARSGAPAARSVRSGPSRPAPQRKAPR